MKAHRRIVGINLLLVFFTIGISTLLFHTYNPFYREWHILVNRCTTCKVAKAAATSDFNNHQYLLVRFGLPDSDTLDSKSYLLKNHQLTIIRGGCVPITEINCYSDQMFKLLYHQYGDQIFPLP